MQNKLNIRIGRQDLEIEDTENFPLSISYHLEMENDFQTKRSSEAFSVVVPATSANSKIANMLHNVNVLDMTVGKQFEKPQPARITVDGTDVLIGKALLQQATHTDKPEKYEYDFYGANGDWIIDLKEKTLWDFVSSATHVFSKAQVEASWNHDGFTANNDYVYAPVRYKERWGNSDDLVSIYHMRPALFIYWLIYRAFDSVGYKIKSVFLQTNYFRRLVMPWVWGDFLRIDSRMLDVIKFRAKATSSYNRILQDPTANAVTVEEWADSLPASSTTNPLVVNNESTDGGYDNNNTYSWSNSGSWVPAGLAMRWDYPAQFFNQFGALHVNFRLKLNCFLEVNGNSQVTVAVHWYKNGVFQAANNVASAISSGGAPITFNHQDFFSSWKSPSVSGGDYIEARLWVFGFKTGPGQLRAIINAGTAASGRDSFLEIESFEKPIGGTVDFKLYDNLKYYKFLDFLGGVLDCFDITPQTDNTTREVVLEPAHSYRMQDVNGTLMHGYFLPHRLDWQNKIDLSKENTVRLFSDGEREQIFGFADDASDGGVKILEERFSIKLGTAKYLLSERFKKGIRERRNRFFTPVAHFVANQWKNITGVAPQIIAIVPENLGTTSERFVEETAFSPKLAWYKGLVSRNTYGGWKWDGDATGAGDTTKDLPYMFAVNYKANGELDPVLTYCDQNINGVFARGLLQRFWLPRLSIMEYGRKYQAWLSLNNKDVQNALHREKILLAGGLWLLYDIENYNPLNGESTQCTLWKYVPPAQSNVAAVYPSQTSVITQPTALPSADIKYTRSLLLNSDLP